MAAQPITSKIVNVRVVTGAKSEQVVRSDNGFLVHTTATPRQGKANQAVITLLASHLKLPKHKIFIHKGHKSSHKQFLLLP